MVPVAGDLGTMQPPGGRDREGLIPIPRKGRGADSRSCDSRSRSVREYMLAFAVIEVLYHVVKKLQSVSALLDEIQPYNPQGSGTLRLHFDVSLLFKSR
jgi:hypothetical protein